MYFKIRRSTKRFLLFLIYLFCSYIRVILLYMCMKADQSKHTQGKNNRYKNPSGQLMVIQTGKLVQVPLSTPLTRLCAT